MGKSRGTREPNLGRLAGRVSCILTTTAIALALTMPIAPITGTLRKQFFTTLTLSLGLGTAAAYGFWYGVHIPRLKRQEEYYLQLEKQRAENA